LIALLDFVYLDRASALLHTHTEINITMGFFSRKKKTTSTGSPSPALLSSPQLPAALPMPEVVPEPVEPPITLSVVLDGWTNGRAVQCFTIQISKDADTTTLRQALSNQIGNVSMSLFKVSHPRLIRSKLMNRSTCPSWPLSKRGRTQRRTKCPSTSLLLSHHSILMIPSSLYLV
jgi:hypothetical protein